MSISRFLLTASVFAMLVAWAESGAAQERADVAVDVRRAWASALEGTPDPGALDLALAQSEDPDASVRRTLARVFGDVAYSNHRATERVERLFAWALDDPDADVRRSSIEALGASALVEAVEPLDRLFESVDDDERTLVAEALAELPAAQNRLLARLQESLDGTRAVAASTIVALFEGYGQALADAPAGGELARERTPFRLGILHPSVAVERAASGALQDFFDRLEILQAYERTDRVLEAFALDGFRSREMLYRRAHLALGRLDRPESALAVADRLIAVPVRAGSAHDRAYAGYGWHFRGAALFALGRREEARTAFEQTGVVFGALMAEREDLRPDLFRSRSEFPQAPAGGALLVDRLTQVALAELWQAFCLVPDGLDDDVRRTSALRSMRQAHEHLLRTELFALRTDTDLGGASWDVVLLDDLAPGPLLLGGRGTQRFSLDESLSWQVELSRLAQTVSGEVPGFEPFESNEPWIDPFADDTRFLLMLEAEQEELSQATREWDATQQRLAEAAAREGGMLENADVQRHPKLLRMLNLRRQMLERERSLDGRDLTDPKTRRTAFSGLLDTRLPSRSVVRLGRRLRADGLSRRARELALRGIDDLGRDVFGAGVLWLDRTRAELELVVGASWTDEGEPKRAERVLESAVGRLEGLENTLTEALGNVTNDPGLVRSYEAWIKETQRMRGGALTSLAVNANVRLKEPERALVYFEEAFELDPSDFNKILLACYRARSGKLAEARLIIQSVSHEPSHYYNLACTYALMGDAEVALDYLAQELEVNHTSAESRARQEEWARSDPDLASLRGNPRFVELVGEGAR